jgi:hypothetical protein
MNPLERRIKKNGKVDIWDCGPSRPAAPIAPIEPDDAKLKGADLAAAQVAHEDACERYKHQLRAYSAAKLAFAEWQETKGGPIKVELWGIDARHAMEVEPERFRLELPRGMKPGRAQIEAEQLAEAEADALDHARASDPQFGQRALA